MKGKRTIVKVLPVTTLSMPGVAASATGAEEKGAWDGSLAGQAGAPVKTDFVKGVVPAAGSKEIRGWNGCIYGQAGVPTETDFAVLPETGSGEMKSWDGYLPGSMSIWQQKL